MATNQYAKYPSTSGGGGGSGMVIGDAVTGGTSGSVLFVGFGNVLAQDNSNFFFDSTTKDLTITGALSASNFSGVNTGDVTLGTPNGLSLVGQVLSLGLASSGVTGALSGTDFDTFNNKQPAGSYLTSLTGDVTGTGPGATATTISSNVVSNLKLAQMPAHTIKGNNTGSTGNAIDLTATQVTAELNSFVGDSGSGGTKGLVPAPVTGDANKFLKGNGTWATVSASGTSVTEYHTITAPEATAKQFTLGSTPLSTSEVVVDVISGGPQINLVDFTISTNVFDWSGLGLDGLLTTGDVVRCHYQA